ncbi:tripartite tricarboxylate transporter substrate binding protein [Neobacillus mesonae]|uniref:Bug family tripartite tricarboxylate transporter substrate binding protein n=1 Tax=Neobacillus mesonae TaxID=1193713 RepID=UPI00203EC741|nr:tripartite tricarboxylate transporter substrate binding protein [Neobacillus mesonae]MCM3570377.1 tripartite tricarboxylate transporter substrate binding protein [Neobacillus mesonae]
MKKIAAILLLVFVMVISAACSSSSSSGKPEKTTKSNGEWQPEKAIEITAPSGAGGGWDTTARMAAKVLSENKIIDQNIGVVNKPGGGGAVGWAYIHSKKADPYKLFITSPPMLLVPLNGQSQFDYKDFTPIANVIADYAAFAVKADAKWNNLNELFADMKKDPSKITIVGASSPGSMDHIQFVKIAKAAGIDITKIKYVSDQDGGALTQILNGSADVYSTGVAETVEQVKAGKIKVLGVTSEERLKGDVLSDFPTAKEQGIDATFVNWRGFFGPPDMDKNAIAYYEKKFKELSDSAEWDEIRQKYGWDEMYMNSSEYKEFLKKENNEIKTLLEELGLAK